MTKESMRVRIASAPVVPIAVDTRAEGHSRCMLLTTSITIVITRQVCNWVSSPPVA
jgi:hypothetical protein